jgi:hypothetical protein
MNASLPIQVGTKSSDFFLIFHRLSRKKDGREAALWGPERDRALLEKFLTTQEGCDRSGWDSVIEFTSEFY